MLRGGKVDKPGAICNSIAYKCHEEYRQRLSRAFQEFSDQAKCGGLQPKAVAVDRGLSAFYTILVKVLKTPEP